MNKRTFVPIASTQEMRNRVRELASPPRDDFDRAVLIILDDFDRLQNSTIPSKGDADAPGSK